MAQLQPDLRAALVAGLAILSIPATLYSQTGAVSSDAAASAGLERLWATALRVDPSRFRVDSAQVRMGMVVVQTSGGTVQAIDAETGGTLWSVGVGRSEYPTMPPGVNSKYVGVTNGTTLYMIDRKSGGVLWQQRLGGSPCAGCALTEERVLVPLDSGLIESYPLKREGIIDQIPERYVGSGGSIGAPLPVGNRVLWSVANGHVFSREQSKELRQFRYRLDDDCSAPPIYMAPYVIAGSRSGNIYALDEKTGLTVWQFACESSISHPLTAIDGALYAITEKAEMFRLNPQTGMQIWYGRDVTRFLAASADRLYVRDLSGRLAVLDAASGARLAVMSIGTADLNCFNTETDRIYFGSTLGVLQCYREMRQPTPLAHTPGFAIPPPKKPGEAPAAATDAGATETGM